MPPATPPRRTTLVFLAALILTLPSRAQDPPTPPTPEAQPATAPQKPLPDIPALMRDVELNQRKFEAVEKNYIYRSAETRQETDSHGQPRKTERLEYDHYFVNGVRVRRLMSKDGKPLPPDELAKENDRIDKQTAKARDRRDKADAQGRETDTAGHDEVTVSRILELGAFTNPRRVVLNGRDTIAVDYAGDPKAKTRNRPEEVIRDMQGTVWVDESDHILARAEGRFANSFHIAGGLVANIQKDTHFALQQTKINDEVWLPSQLDAQGAARFLLFFSFTGNIHVTNTDFRKFRTTSTILPADNPSPK